MCFRVVGVGRVKVRVVGDEVEDVEVGGKLYYIGFCCLLKGFWF